MKNKKFKTGLSLLLMFSILLTGVMAFLSASDEIENVFVVGDIEIVLHEDDYEENELGKYVLKDSEDLYIYPGQKLPKAPYIENIGNAPAWIYMTVGIPVIYSETDELTITNEEFDVIVKGYGIQDGYNGIHSSSKEIWDSYFSAENCLGPETNNKENRKEMFYMSTEDVTNSFGLGWELLDATPYMTDEFNWYTFAYLSELQPKRNTSAVFDTIIFSDNIKSSLGINGIKVGEMTEENTITLYGSLPADTYTIKLEGNNKKPLSDAQTVCKLTISNEKNASYDDLIPENGAPSEAKQLGVYNSQNEKVGIIPFSETYNEEKGQKLYSLGMISDVHIGYDTSEDDFKKALQYFSNEKVSFVGVAGDLTAGCLTEELESYKSIIDNYSNVPVYSVTGNHDTKEYYNSAYYANDKASRKSDISDIIKSYTGQDMYYSVTQGNDVYIFLSIDDGYVPGRIFDRAQLEWLQQTLEANKNKRCIIIEHVRPDNASGNITSDPDLLQSIDLWEGTETIIFEDLLNHYPNVTILHGHSHTAFELQSTIDSANYNKVGLANSFHIPALVSPRNLDEQGYRIDYEEQSQGYIIEVYENGYLLQGLDFVNEQIIPIGTYWVNTPIKETQENVYIDETVTIGYDTIIPTWTHGQRPNGTTGVLYDEPGYSVTNMIPIMENRAYYVHQAWKYAYSGQIYYYDADGTYINRTTLWADGDLLYTSPVRLNIPANAKYFRLSQWSSEVRVIATKDVFVTHRDTSLEPAPKYTNVLETVGYEADKRLSGSSGELRDNTGTMVTGMIPCKKDDILYLKNIEMPINGGDYTHFIAYYNPDGTFKMAYDLTADMSYVTTNTNGNIVGIVMAHEGIGFCRLSVKSIDDTSIITVNEPLE